MISHKIRLYPTKTQETRLEDTIETCRILYNDLLFESRLAFREGYKLTYNELQRTLPAMTQGKTLYAKVAQMVLRQFYSNLKVLSALSKKGKRIGKLRYKSRNQFRSFTYNQLGFCLYSDNILKLSKIGKIRCVITRSIKEKIKEIHIKKELTGHWYATIVCENKTKFTCSLLRKKNCGD